MAKLAVTIITLNEAQNLPDCIRSVSFADDVLVVDSGSTDQTVAIARELGARVIENPWPGFAAQREFAMEHARGDWCLMLDADERVSPELQSALALAVMNGAESDGVNGYMIPFETRLFDRTLKHGRAKFERHLRLLRRGCAHWRQNGAKDDVTVSGKVSSLRAPIVHMPYQSLTDCLDNLNIKTSQQALDLYQRGMRFNARCALRQPFDFFYRYVLMLGFLDGWEGFLHAAMSSLFDFVARAKLFDLERIVAEQNAVQSAEFIPRLATPVSPLDLEAVAQNLPPNARTIEMPVPPDAVLRSDDGEAAAPEATQAADIAGAEAQGADSQDSGNHPA